MLFRLLSIAAFCTLSIAASAQSSTVVFPPANCASDYDNVITWRNGAGTTYCKTAQDVIDLALPNCSNGQVVVKELGRFTCKTPGAEWLGRQYVGAYCPGSDTCYVFCPAGKIVVGGGCFSNRAYGLQGSKAVVYNQPDPDGAVSVAPGPNAFEGWQCIYANSGGPPTDIEAQAICITAGFASPR